jgi:mRNA interferase RelE/StbE
MTYTIVITPRAERQIRSLERPTRTRVIQAIEGLANDPRPPGAIKLVGREGYRLRVGDYRIIYTIDDAGRIVIVAQVGHRRDIYR